MTRWDEEHFLDTIIPLLAEMAATERVPDCETPSAGVEEERPSEVISLRALKSFPARDLALRLQGFDNAVADPPDEALEQAEERLDQWMRGFLASATVNAQRQSAERLPAKTRLAGLSGFFNFNLTRWILIPAAVCSVIVISFFAGRRSLSPREREYAANQVPAQANQAVAGQPTSTNTRPETRRETTPAQPQGAASTTGLNSKTDLPSTPPRAGRPDAELPANHNAQVNAPSPEFHQAPPGEVELSEAASQSGSDKTSTQFDKVPNVAISPGPAASRPAPNVRPSTPVAVRAARSINGNSNRVASAPASRSNVPVRNLVQLEAGTRVWISLKSVRRQSEALAEFDGTLLLPVTQSGSVVLDRDTLVSGTISTVGGKATIQIRELHLNGVPYELTSAGGGMTVHAASAGTAVEFDAGKVIETWMSSASTYSRRADGQVLPNPK